MTATFPDLEGASVFITGGGSGIGAAITDAFLGQGAKVAFVQRSDPSDFLDRMEAKHGRRPWFQACDITDLDALNGALAAAAEAHGPIGVLVNNAANDKRHKTEDVTPEFWDQMIAINLRAYFFATKAVVPGMRKMGGGSIVNFSSISYMMGHPDMPVYTTSNSGINGMVRSHAREFGPDRIRVNAIAPGWVFTERQLEEIATPEDIEAHIESQCLKERMKPEDIAEPVLFLASDASRMMTGQALVVDAGVVVTG
ncbi:SDR family NAD(P)-dependent oxidoreductase [Oceaniglobus roseus]|uniref:SDR family NAD(P)-dependent oxidoreductase n=1 Tax=Oceaniglobus roseus TaxID=1737570 RepID=UPI000C7F7471|nr:SDR family oxidoreductase [Kandeliimicrobium roseum]